VVVPGGAAGAYADLVVRLEACFLDAYDTIVYTDYTAYRHELPAMAGISPEALYGGFRQVAPALTVGQISMAEAFGQILRAAGVEPEPGLVRAMADKSRELLLLSGRVYDDVLPFLRELKSRDIKIAVISNCDENTRDLLAELGVAALADALVLSNEVGAAKPAAQIYQCALDKLSMSAEAALFVDNNATYCAGAATLGIRAVQMIREAQDVAREGRDVARVKGEGDAATGALVVRSLPELAVLL
jgi:HAD superfamily hydrolase (TIGR01509 family)